MKARTHVTLEELIKLQFEARGFSLLPRQPVNSLLSGRHASRLRGRGLTFEELRDYRPGDDIRSMDWRATARLRKPHIRVYSEERERPVLLVVDQRSGMFFGSRRTTKASAAAEFAALAAWRSIDVGDRVGAIVFNDKEAIEVRPNRSRSNVMRICHELTAANQKLSSSQQPAELASAGLNDALRRAVKVAKHDHLVVVISDLAGDDDETRKHATYLAAHNDMLAVLVYDPLGIRFSATGQMTATDGKQQLEIPKGEQFSDLFESEFSTRCEILRERLRSLRIPILPICTHESVTLQVMTAFGCRR